MQYRIDLISAGLIPRCLQRLVFYIYKVPEGRHNNSKKRLYYLKAPEGGHIC